MSIIKTITVILVAYDNDGTLSVRMGIAISSRASQVIISAQNMGHHNSFFHKLGKRESIFLHTR
jgi:hypothetical protein